MDKIGDGANDEHASMHVAAGAGKEQCHSTCGGQPEECQDVRKFVAARAARRASQARLVPLTVRWFCAIVEYSSRECHTSII